MFQLVILIKPYKGKPKEEGIKKDEYYCEDIKTCAKNF